MMSKVVKLILKLTSQKTNETIVNFLILSVINKNLVFKLYEP